MVKEPLDILEELKLAGPRDEYDRLILSSESIYALTILAALCREKDQLLQHQAREHEKERARLAWELVKQVGPGYWSSFVDQGELGREILAEMAGKEHNPETCGCKYRGMNMWSCGHIDGEGGDLDRRGLELPEEEDIEL